MPDSPRPKNAATRHLGNHPALIVIVGVVALAIINSVVGSGDDGSSHFESSTSSTSSPATVLYELEGSVAYADVTMVTPTGIEQITPDVPLKTRAGETGLTWSFSRGEFVSISAQMKGGSGVITCRITVDGVVISENTSSAAYGIASCDGTA